jgi:AcrR family transcriptional regulator
VIVTQGLSAPTAVIAKKAGVANGSLFTYFETKTDLFNQLYRELKAEMAAAALEEYPAEAQLRKQLSHVWSNWTGWAVSNADKRRALALLDVCDEITPASRAAGHKAMAGLANLLERIRGDGPMRKVPIGFVAAIMNSLADATIDFMIRDPVNADKHCSAGFDAMWRMIT